MNPRPSIAPADQKCSALTIPPDEIHVYRSALDVPDSEDFGQVLSADEHGRAARFRFERDRRRFVVARAFLRSTLAKYLNVGAGELQFSYTEYGKPFLTGTGAKDKVSFNLAHSHELAVLAVACGREVGIDVEHRRPGFASDSIAEQFFAADEVRGIQSLPAELQEAAFFACWTRKEAYIKARGQGLSIPLHEFVVSTSPGRLDSALLYTAHDPSAVSHWSVRDLPIDDGYSATLAFEHAGSAVQVLCRS